ncbi:carbohydrate ABC transporter permease, partial [Enterococcus faecalis]
SLAANGYRFWPKEFSLQAYAYNIQGPISQRIIHPLGVTVFITVTGTIVNATKTSLYAYVISRTNIPFKKFFTLFALITM